MDKIEITVMTDAEFENYHKEKRRQDFLKELQEVSNSKTRSHKSFSIKDFQEGSTKPEKKPEPVPTRQSTSEDDEEVSLGKMIEGLKKPDLSSEWAEFVSDMGEENYSPIEDVTEGEITRFKNNPSSKANFDTGDFNDTFKKENAMISDVLKTVKVLGDKIGKDILKYNASRKGAGITKNYTDLIAAYNGIVHNEVQLIDKMANLKAKQVDWQFKDKSIKKDNLEGEQSVDSLVNQYYSRVIDGGSMKDYNQAAMRNYEYADFKYNEIEESPDVYNIKDTPLEDASNLDSSVISTGFNISQPLKGQRGRGAYYDSIEGDAHGNIAHEHTQMEICVFKYGDILEFAAVDPDGNVVDGVELPSDENPGILANMVVRPGSDYIYDPMGRKYRLYEQDGVDISDIDEMEYPYDSDDDK